MLLTIDDEGVAAIEVVLDDGVKDSEDRANAVIDFAPAWVDANTVVLLRRRPNEPEHLAVVELSTGFVVAEVELPTKTSNFGNVSSAITPYAPMPLNSTTFLVNGTGKVWQVSTESGQSEILVDYSQQYEGRLTDNRVLLPNLVVLAALDDSRLVLSDFTRLGVGISSGDLRGQRTLLYILDLDSGELAPVFAPTTLEDPYVGPYWVLRSPDGGHGLIAWGEVDQFDEYAPPVGVLSVIDFSDLSLPVDPRSLSELWRDRSGGLSMISTEKALQFGTWPTNDLLAIEGSETTVLQLQ